jgi:OmcA/MtrC family decaheme c-type cytochrome
MPLRSNLVAAIAAGALFVLPMSNTRVTRVVSRVGASNTDPKALYDVHEKEYWLSTDEFDYVRPGFVITVNGITINGNLQPVVDVSYTDSLGVPLDRAGVLTPGAISMSFILAWWDPNARNYTSYTTRSQTSSITGVTAVQASADSGGTFQDLDIGHSIYTFKTKLPAGYDATATTTLGIYATRDTTAVLGKPYYANVEQDFVPNGAPVTQAWDILSNAACNQCHNPLSAHGGSRQDVKLCVLCHSPQTADPDTGNTVDFKVMVHKIHMGSNLPSVQAGMPYQIIGFQNSVNDFSTVVFPQDIRNCDTCHSGPTPPSQSANWYTFPSRAACGACHDDVNFTTGANHDGGPQSDDSQCASCHVIPAPGHYDDIDAPIGAAHWVPYKSDQLLGIQMTILSVTNSGPGQNPTVSYQVTDKNGNPMDPRPFDTLQFTLGGPTTDYSNPPISENAQAASSYNGSVATYTFSHAIPANATGTWTLTADVQLAAVITRPNALPPINTLETAANPIFYIAMTDPQPVPRREVVDVSHCNSCHDRLAAHGGRRVAVEECVICHNPSADDSSQRPAAELPAESIDFKRMIHRIHRGTNLTHDYTVYGYQGSVHTFNSVLFPGDLRDCQKCHTTDASGVGTEQVSGTPPPGLLPTTTAREWYSPMQHYATACLGCHDTQPAAAHTYTMTAPFGEACAGCHAPTASFSVDMVHAR